VLAADRAQLAAILIVQSYREWFHGVRPRASQPLVTPAGVTGARKRRFNRPVLVHHSRASFHGNRSADPRLKSFPLRQKFESVPRLPADLPSFASTALRNTWRINQRGRKPGGLCLGGKSCLRGSLADLAATGPALERGERHFEAEAVVGVDGSGRSQSACAEKCSD
jgi:hypothetical protein